MMMVLDFTVINECSVGGVESSLVNERWIEDRGRGGGGVVGRGGLG